MNPDEFDEMIRANDPAADPIDTATEDSLVFQTRQQWGQLSLQRRRVRRRLTLCLAAAALFAVVGASTAWIGRNNGHSDRTIASMELPEIEQNDAVVNGDEDSGPLDETKGSGTIQSLADSKPNLRSRRHLHTQDGETDELHRLAEFATFVQKAGKKGSQTWLNARSFLARQDAGTQREAIYLVPRLTDPSLRLRAFDLVCEAAGNSRRAVLKVWMNDQQLGELAWNRLIENATLEQATELIPLARKDSQRVKVCREIAASPNSQAIEVLLNLARDPAWRSSVGSSASNLHHHNIQTLIMSMRHRSASLRTAAAFMLASVPGDHVDQVVANMIVNGRYRQPAYLVLLSRDTPQARAFLAQASSDPELTPALVSARMHFANIQQLLYQWIAESKGTHHEPFDNTQSLVPEKYRGDRPVRRDDNHGQYS